MCQTDDKNVEIYSRQNVPTIIILHDIIAVLLQIRTVTNKWKSLVFCILVGLLTSDIYNIFTQVWYKGTKYETFY